jgi:hypothetical protein
VERAQALERVDTGPLEGDELAHDVGNVDALPHLVNVRSSN